ncbi:MAG: ATP-grasp domain-containing protein [Chloroflexi bacterium]|nr:ATP-grasp domain-containing protein [Chloroflexota bacterium]
MKHLLILGAGEDQLPAYREAPRLGLRTIGVDQRADAPAVAAADRFHAVSTRDVASIIAAVGDADVAAVVAPASDAAQLTLRALEEHYETPFRTPEAGAQASIDKGYLRGVLDELGLPAYRWSQSREDRTLLRNARRMRFPLMVKPSDGSGSKGVEMATTPAELPKALMVARSFSASGEVIIEEFVAGRHVSVEAFLDGGRIVFLAATRRQVTGPPHFITVSHLIPADLDDHLMSRLRRAIELICAAVAIKTGPVNFDVVIDEHGDPYVIELGARVGGNGMPALVYAAFGVNTVRAAIRCALGRPFRLEPARRRMALLHILHSDRDGVLESIHGEALVRRRHPSARLDICAAVGAPVRAYTSARHKLGYLTLTGATRAEIDGRLAEILQTLRFDVRTDMREAA